MPFSLRRLGVALVSALAAVSLAATSQTLVAAPAAAASAVPAEFVFDGAGWGHGVGMSQYGAQGQAIEGKTAEQILEHYYAPATLTSATALAGFNQNRELLVQLLHASSSGTAVTITPVSGRLRVIIDGNVDAPSRTASPVTLKLDSSGGITVSGGVTKSGRTVDIEWQNTRYWTEGTTNTTVSVSGADGGSSAGKYRHGRIEVSALNGRLNVLNRLRLEGEYLYGIAEMPSSWAPAALQAQAVAARTYALRNATSVKSACGCHVYDEVTSQKFTAWKKESEGTNAYYGKRWTDAVDASRNRVMTYNSRLIDAVYFSSSGGATRDARDVWGGDVAYLRTRSDEWSDHERNPNRAWTVRVSQAALAGAFRMNDVVSVALTHGADKAVATATATASNGAKVTITGTNLRARLGLKAAWIRSIAPQKPALTVDRIAGTAQYGTDRYGTAVVLSRASYPGGAPVVYVATGTGYADALVAGPAAARERGPLLLTRSTALPAAVKAEISRLAPSKIVVVGGTGAVSDAVLRDLRTITPNVHRRGGADRYETAAKVVRGVYTSATTAYVATGQDYPDALSASAAAGANSAPVLLVKGDAGAVHPATAAALDDLGVTRTYVAGGPTVVSKAIHDHLPGPVRVYGSDRFGTNQKLNATLVKNAGRAYLATGFDYPDALAGAAVAGAQRAPLYLSRPQCVPSEIHSAVTASSVTRVTLLGGTGVLGRELESFSSC